MKKLPIKKLPLITILVALVLAIGLLLFIGRYSKKEAFSGINIWGAKETVIESQNIDTDNDGLKDWEEELYKTDPYNPDTDGDGYLDGEEVNSGHNPLIKAPNDKQVFYPLPLGEKYNITDKIFADIDTVFRSYLHQKDEYIKDHPEIDSPEEFLAQASPDTLEELFRRAVLYNERDWLAQAEKILEQLPEVFQIEISDSDINISEDSGPEAIKTYTDKLLAYLNSESFFLTERNFILLKDSLPQDNFSQLDKLIKDNDSEIKRLRETTVPSSWKEVHKKTLKIAITLRNIFVSLRGWQSDPVKALVGANEVKNVLKTWEVLVEEFNNLSQSQGLDLSI